MWSFYKRQKQSQNMKDKFADPEWRANWLKNFKKARWENREGKVSDKLSAAEISKIRRKAAKKMWAKKKFGSFEQPVKEVKNKSWKFCPHCGEQL